MINTGGVTDDPGVEGNYRLTSANGIVLLVLLAIEGVTILSVRAMLTLHIFLGVLLIGPVCLKTASTLYRFARYYQGARSYRENGPPHWLLRVLGPLVVLTSLAVLGTGVALLAVRPNEDSALLTAHQGSFIAWVIVMCVHVLGHIRTASVTTWREIRSPAGTRDARGRQIRFGLIALALFAGVAAATALLPAASPWTNAHFAPHGHSAHR